MSQEFLHHHHSFRQMSQENDVRSMAHLFLKEIGFTPRQRSQYSNVVERYPDGTLPDAIFAEAFPGFPFTVRFLPSAKTKEFTRMDKWWGTKGERIFGDFERFAAMDVEGALSNAILMVMRFPYLKDLFVMHNAESGTMKGHRFCLYSEAGYSYTVQGLKCFRSEWSDQLAEYLGDEMDGAG